MKLKHRTTIKSHQNFMTRLVWLHLLVGLVCGHVQADAPSTNATTPLASRSTPSDILKRIPPGGRSRFYGASQFKVEGQTVFVHVYDAARAHSNSPATSARLSASDLEDYNPNERDRQKAAGGSAEVRHAAIELYVQDEKSKSSRKLHSKRFKYLDGLTREHNANLSQVTVESLWLNDRTRRVPILKINIRRKGFVGDLGTEMLVLFPEGFKMPSRVTGFSFGASNAGGGELWSTAFDRRDAEGNLLITSVWDTPYGGSEDTYRWDGKSFALIEHRSLTH